MLGRKIISSVTVSLCLFFTPLVAAQQQEQKDQATSTYEGVKERFGNADAVSKNLTSPLTSGTSFRTLDGKTAFDQRLSCPSSHAYLEVFYGIGAGGDLSPISVQQDTNFDGSYDWSVAFRSPISGVCANGIISCAPGTFTDCKHYRWSVSGVRLGLTETDLSDLAGCYCVNNSCGNSLAFANRSTTLDDLSGGMAGALMQADARYAVSTVSREDFVIRLSGQDAGACGLDGGGNQEKYVDSPSTLSSDAFAASASDPVFGLVSNIPSGDDIGLTRNDCLIERQVTLKGILASDIITRITSTADYVETGCAGDPDCFFFELGNDKDNHIEKKGCNIFTEEVVWNVDNVERLREAVLINSTYEDQIHVSLNGTLIYNTGGFNGVTNPNKCQIDDQAHVTINRSFKGLLKEGTNRLVFKIAVRKRGSGLIRGRISYTPDCDLEETVDGTCGPYAANDDCRLLDEDVDGVSTWHNGGRTGLTPLQQTRTLFGAKCTETFTRDWFERSRTYECESEADGAQSFNFARSSHILGSSGIDQYSDIRPGADGSLQNFTGSYTIDIGYGIGDCEQICKVTKEETDTEVSATGVVGALHKNPNTQNYNYLTCVGNVCPVGPGETIEKDCGCLSEFNDAITVMQTFRLAGQDLTCTTGTRQSIE